MTRLSQIPEVSSAEIDRAIALLRGNEATRILNARIEPRWQADGKTFRYRRELPNGSQMVEVDARSGAANVVDEVADPPGAPSGLLVSPDGTRAIFRRANNLWIRHLDTGAEGALTSDGALQFGYGMPSDRYDQNKLEREREGIVLPPVQTWWSPDSRWIVCARLDQRHLAPYPYLENAPQDGSFRPFVREVRLPLMGEPAGRLDWWLFDLAVDQARPIDFPVERMIAANNGIDDLKVGWDIDEGRFLAISGMADLVGGEVFAVDLSSGRARSLLQDFSSPQNPLVAGGYGRPVARFIEAGRKLIWWSQRDGWGHLYLYDTHTGELLCRLTEGEWLVRDIVGVDETRGQVWFTAMGREPGNPYHRYLYRVGLDGNGLELMTPEAGDHMIIDPTGSPLVFDGAGPTETLSPDFAHYAYDVSSITEPTRSVLRRATDGALVTTFERADASAIQRARFRPPEEITTLSANGDHTLHGLVYRPSDWSPDERYPVIDIEYGNPAVAITPRTYHRAAFFGGDPSTPAATAELGFIVVVVDATGTPYRSRSFSQAGPDYLETMGLEDHIAFIREVARRDPSLDLNRVGITGQSFGGNTAIRAMIEFPEFYRVAVAGSPQTSYHSMAAEAVLTASRGPPIYSDGSSLRPTPFEVPLNFSSLDCAEQLDRIKGPLLIIAGEQDENVYPGNVVQFMDRAIHQNRNIDWIWMPNEMHQSFYTPYALRRSWEFFTRHLQSRLLPMHMPPLPSPVR